MKQERKLRAKMEKRANSKNDDNVSYFSFNKFIKHLNENSKCEKIVANGQKTN